MNIFVSWRVMFVGILVSVTVATPDFACASGQASPTQRPSEAVIATVNGNAITVADFNTEVDRLTGMSRALVATPDGVRDMIDSLILREMAAQEARKSGFSESKRFKLKLQNMIKSFTASEYLTEKIEQATELSPTEIKQYYDENILKYQAGERLRVSNLQVGSESLAIDLLARIKSGERYEVLAREYSTDKKSAHKGGDKGWFDRGALGEPFDASVADLKAGEVSNVIKSRDGFHIVKVSEIRESGTRALDEATPLIKEELVTSQRAKALQKVKTRLRSSAIIKIDSETQRSLVSHVKSEGRIEITPIETAPAPITAQ